MPDQSSWPPEHLGISMESKHVLTGTIKRLVTDKGFGVVAAAEGGEYFFHQSALLDVSFEELREGQAVVFEEVHDQKGQRAESVRFGEPREGESVHILVAGDTSTGKSTLSAEMLETTFGNLQIPKAPNPGQMYRGPISVPLKELHSPRNGRIDASRVAGYLAVPLSQLAAALEASYAAVHKTPDASSLQLRLAPVKRALVLIAQITRDRGEALAWLNSPHPDLGGKTPLEALLAGHADAIVTLLENASAGLPS
jgi:cold shock protein